MKNTKKKYVNEDIDGYKKENQSPLAPAWLFSGKQNEGKVLTGGPDGFVVWGSGGGSGGTTDYNLLDNKPQLNGEELIGNTILTYSSLENKPKLNGVELTGNITFPYVKTASINGNTLTLTLVDSNQQETSLNFEINVESIKNAILAEVATQYFNKQEILDSFYTKSQINDSFYTKTDIDSKITVINTNINDKTSKTAIYSQNKSIIKQGDYIQLTKDDANKTITIAQSLRPEPEAPITGIVFKDDAANDYVILNNDDVFDPTHTTINGTYANSEGSYSSPRVYFNPQNKIIVNSDVPNLAKSNASLGFFGDCNALNTPIDLSLASTSLPTSNVNWDTTGGNFLKGCQNFNSTITFNNKITKIQLNFMDGCVRFNNQLINLFTPSLKEINMNFMQSCYNFAQDLDFSNTSLDSGNGFNKIILINFMWNCHKMGGHNINLGTKGLNCIKQTDYSQTYIQYVNNSLATNNESSSAYVNGINFICYNATAQDFYNFSIPNSVDPNDPIYVFRKSTSSPFKKILVNGVEVQ